MRTTRFLSTLSTFPTFPTLRPLPSIAAAALLALLSACGGSSGEAPATSGPSSSDGLVAGATRLSYVDPAGSGWRLVRDASSTDTRLVLDLVGPADATVRGAGFNLARGPALVFSRFGDGRYAHDTGVFQLKGTNANFESYAGSDADPVLFASAPVKDGTVLSTGIFQKDRTNGAKPASAPLVQVAVSLADAATIPKALLGPGLDPYRLSVVKARIVPADIGGMNFSLDIDTLKKARMQDITVAVGTLTASR